VSGPGDLMSGEEIAERFGIKPQSVHSFMRRYGVEHVIVAGWPRDKVERIERKPRGRRRTDLHATTDTPEETT
jgi:uncharacterized protein YjcR